MPAFRTELIATLIDRISGPAKMAAKSLDGLVSAGGRSGKTIFGKPAGDAAKKGKTSANQSIHFNPIVTVHAPNATKPHQVAAEVERVMRDKVATLFRGSYSDVGMSTT